MIQASGGVQEDSTDGFTSGGWVFGEGMEPGLLALIERRASVQGTLIVTYQEGGSLPSIAESSPPPIGSPRETERQAPMAQGEW